MLKFVHHSLGAITIALAATVPAQAREEIRAFTADIVVQRDGSARVTETIVVNAEGGQIRRGIFRDIPVTMARPDGGTQRSDLKVESVIRDGSPEPFAVERDGDFERVRIGQQDHALPPGQHRYAVTYRMSGAVRHHRDADEIYWNATGNYWSFPILTAVANVTLPDGVKIGKVAGYTGGDGSREQAVAISRPAATVVSFQSSRPLGPREGLTVAVSFAKGAVANSAPSEARTDWIPIALALLVAFMVGAWLVAGRSPARGDIPLRFVPPRDMSPALVYFVRNGGRNDTGWTAMIAAIVDFAVQGLLTIAHDGRCFSISTTGKKPDRPLPGAEESLFAYLIAERTVVIDAMGGGRLSWQRAKFMKRLAADNRGVWFRSNAVLIAVGFVLAIGFISAMAWMGALSGDGLIGAAIGIVSLAMLSMIAPNFLRKPTVRRAFLGFVGVATLAALINALCADRLGGLPDIGATMAGAAVLLAFGFAMVMPAPTPRGAETLAEIEGFRRYLDAPSQQPSPGLNGPTVLQSRFEAILPYAIALGVERQWSSWLETALARDADNAEDWERYNPLWYPGRYGAFASSGIGETIAGTISAMSAAMVASQPSDSSSSGSDGMGSSGGGSGGGGGGGW